nr:hypothetical protein [Heyndrickxia oleronia]
MNRKEWDIREKQNIEYDINNYKQNLEIGIHAHEMIKTEGVLAQYDFFDAVEEYLSSPIEKSIKSTDIIIKLLSFIDRRVGKRTLQKLNEYNETEHESISYFLKLRCDAEGIGK